MTFNRWLRVLMLFAGGWAVVSTTAAVETKPADLLVFNARVWTGTENDRPVTAVAVRDDKIVDVGDNTMARAYIGPMTKVIDADGRRLVPGMTDSHLHLISGGMTLDQIDLRDVGDRDAFVSAVARAAGTRDAQNWILGGRWSVESWARPESPSRAWIDDVTGDVPVLLHRMDGHQALVNSAALRIAGITKDGPADPPGGQIERDPETQAPTGILKESAVELVARHVPQESIETRLAALDRATKHAHAHGVTTVHDMSEPEDLAAYRRAKAEGRLMLRVVSYPQFTDWQEQGAVVDRSAGDHSFRIAGVKAYMDGSIGSRTAYMHEPYEDSGSTCLHPRGQLTADAQDPARFFSGIKAIDAAGGQMAVHAIGDEANHMLLDMYERLAHPAAKHRIEHAQHLRPGDVERFARLGVVASMQPLHKADDGRYAERILGRERLAGSYAFRQLLDSGAWLVFGSDWPVVSLDPMKGIAAAVNARTLDGKVWLPEHSLKVDEALRAYTLLPHRVVGWSDALGTIEKGKLADMVLLNKDPMEVPPEDLATVSVFLTIFNGRIVYGPNG